jgi:hypothetical protein
MHFLFVLPISKTATQGTIGWGLKAKEKRQRVGKAGKPGA